MKVVSRVDKTRVDEAVDELAIQKAFESNLEAIEEGLTYIASFVPVGTGIIDTLAVDDENNAVLIEFKRDEFSSDALIQLMNYYAWFEYDENHKTNLRDVIKKVKPEFEEVEEIRLMAVASEFDDKVKNACWALEPSIKLISFILFRDNNGELNLVPFDVLDTSMGGERRVPLPKTEEDHLEEHENLRPLYINLKKLIQEKIDPNVKINPAPKNYIAFVRKRNFATIHFKDKRIRIDLLLKANEIGNNSRYKDFPTGEWGYVHVSSESEINEELLNWLRKAYDKAG